MIYIKKEIKSVLDSFVKQLNKNDEEKLKWFKRNKGYFPTTFNSFKDIEDFIDIKHSGKYTTIKYKHIQKFDYRSALGVLGYFRGLTFNNETNKILSYGVRKSINYDTLPLYKLQEIYKDNKLLLSEKIDGTCIQVFKDNDEIIVSTLSGTKLSLHTELARELIKPFEHLLQPNVAYIFEMVSTDNNLSIVVRYNKTALYYLFSYNIETGEVLEEEPLPTTLMPTTKEFTLGEVYDQLQALPIDSNFEGYMDIRTGLKFKSTNYRVLHKIRESNYNINEIHNLCVNNKNITQLKPCNYLMETITTYANNLNIYNLQIQKEVDKYRDSSLELNRKELIEYYENLGYSKKSAVYLMRITLGEAFPTLYEASANSAKELIDDLINIYKNKCNK